MALYEGLMVNVRDSVFDPDSTAPVVQVRDADKANPIYRVFLFLEGAGVPFVSSVTYALRTSPDRPEIRRVRRTLTNSRFKLELWTWAVYDVDVTIVDQAGRRDVRTYRLTFDRELRGENVSYMLKS